MDLLLVGGRIATCDGQGDALARLDIQDAVIGIEAGVIAYIGQDDAVSSAQRVDLDGATVMPGLVDPHTHLVFGGSRVDEFAQRMAGADYRKIAAQGGGIASSVRATRQASDEALYESARTRALWMRSQGITAVEIKSGYGLSVADELRCLRAARRLDEEGILRVSTTFLGGHAIPPEHKDDRRRYVRQVVDEQLPAVAEAGLADTCDVYCDDGAFTLDEAREILSTAKGLGLAVRAHAGQFADLGAAELVAELGGLSADHLEEISDAGLEAMAQSGVSAVLLPGAWRTLRQQAPRGDRFRQAGVRVAIGTDLNPGTSPTTDLLMCASLAVRDAHLTLEEALLGVTVEAARAAGLPQLGKISVGTPADLAVFPVSDPRALAYAIGGIRPIQVYLGGKRVHEAPTFGQLW